MQGVIEIMTCTVPLKLTGFWDIMWFLDHLVHRIPTLLCRVKYFLFVKLIEEQNNVAINIIGHSKRSVSEQFFAQS